MDLSRFNDAFFRVGGFAVSAVYTPVAGAAKTVQVIFDSAAVVPQGSGEIGVPLAVPVAVCKAADVSDATVGATLAIEGVTYNVSDPPLSDGTGITVLKLSRD